ncbi:HPP family protein [Thalassotalea sediminis]|uniref:HPP family protein n=1 Tax=Thalassotalea sediminis TaxID=1759089 RepID=UPI00257282F6|nr:HPP family protein [Thalassotalea sediminis]
MKTYLTRMRAKGHCPPRKPFKKILWSWLGAFIGILLVAYLGEILRYDNQSMLLLIGSFGASAVLIYGAPLAEFSQPRNVIGGHVFSAFVGVSVYLLIPSFPMFASALAVSLSIVMMQITRTLHPPGGATALIAVIGPQSIHQLGYFYVISPVLIGSLLLLFVALFVNNMSRNPKRHYPVYWL